MFTCSSKALGIAIELFLGGHYAVWWAGATAHAPVDVKTPRKKKISTYIYDDICASGDMKIFAPEKA